MGDTTPGGGARTFGWLRRLLKDRRTADRDAAEAVARELWQAEASRDLDGFRDEVLESGKRGGGGGLLPR